MKPSVLERILNSNRLRGDSGGANPPILMHLPTSQVEGPWVTSLTRRAFVKTRMTSDGYIGQGFSKCPIDDEDSLLSRLFSDLWSISSDSGWSNRCSKLDQAIPLMSSFGMVPSFLTVPFSSLSQVLEENMSEEDVEKISLTKGYITEVSGIKVISARAALPEGSAILSTTRGLTGYYNRARDFVGVSILKANQSLVLVKNDLA